LAPHDQAMYMTRITLRQRRHTQPFRHQAGQNLVELALVLPLFLVMLFMIGEFGRAWYTYNAAKMAAMDGSYTAASRHNASAGQTQCSARLAQSNLGGNCTVNALASQFSYQAQVNVTFTPLFGGVSIPTVGGTAISIIPNVINIQYTNEVDGEAYI
jgi:Flp pilus assembly protein TadG